MTPRVRSPGAIAEIDGAVGVVSVGSTDSGWDHGPARLSLLARIWMSYLAPPSSPVRV